MQLVSAAGFVRAARLAQLVERKALNLVVVGSSPTVGVLPGEEAVAVAQIRLFVLAM